MELVKLRMLTSGPNGNYKPGEAVLVDEARARLLIDGEHAEMYTQKAKGKRRAVKDGD